MALTVAHTGLDKDVGQGVTGPLTLPKEHNNVMPCPYCGTWIMFRWGQHGFRAYTAREQVRTVRCQGTRPHWYKCRRFNRVNEHKLGGA